MRPELASPTAVPGTEPVRTVATHCPYCALQCGMELHVSRRPGHERPDVRLTPADFPTNRGGLCAKGWSAADLLAHPERLTTPLVRTFAGDRSSALREATWDEALDAVAAAVRATQRRYGRDAVGCFGGGGLTNEKAYLLGKFARTVLRTRSIDYNGRWCMSSAAAAATRTFGIDRGLPFPVADLALADVLLLVGANPAETMPPLVQHLEAGRERGARHVVVDPRTTATARAAHLHLQPRPGTDAALANGLLHLVVRRGWVDEEYVAARTMGFETVRESVTGYWPDRVERITGVPARDLEAVAELLGTAATAMVVTARGAEQHASGTATAQAFVNLALALGLPGRPGSGYGTLTGQGNGQGGREHGQKADQLPGYRKLADRADRAHVAGVWGVDPTRLPGPGVSATEMLRALGTSGGVRTLLLLASNVGVSAPDAGRVTDRLDALDFLVVADLFLSESAARADVVLPVAMWAEEDGTVTLAVLEPRPPRRVRRPGVVHRHERLRRRPRRPARPAVGRAQGRGRSSPDDLGESPDPTRRRTTLAVRRASASATGEGRPPGSVRQVDAELHLAPVRAEALTPGWVSRAERKVEGSEAGERTARRRHVVEVIREDRGLRVQRQMRIGVVEGRGRGQVVGGAVRRAQRGRADGSVVQLDELVRARVRRALGRDRAAEVGRADGGAEPVHPAVEDTLRRAPAVQPVLDGTFAGRIDEQGHATGVTGEVHVSGRAQRGGDVEGGRGQGVRRGPRQLRGDAVAADEVRRGAVRPPQRRLVAPDDPAGLQHGSIHHARSGTVLVGPVMATAGFRAVPDLDVEPAVAAR
ncbi:molybdopterin oxidoreductase family protein [Cellulomonas flavigena]|uniref:molybdopterin oxidoreductase family protein n=1 Tax=Cellulomonas flavigena TaxID=1711 RepID=UPI0002E2CC0A|nr:molybdopterin-dependent oxidoreductase [Cellulomonas flavigena]